MIRSFRNVSLLTFAALSLALATGCKGGQEQAPNPKPPPEAPPPPQAPKMGAPEQAPAGEAPQGEAEKPAQAKPEVPPEAKAEADQLWTTLCSTCHGPSGAGDGPVSAGFPVKPRNMQDPEWQKSTTDEDIAKVILDGGAAIGKSPLMPGNPQLKGKPEVVEALVQKVRSLGKQ